MRRDSSRTVGRGRSNERTGRDRSGDGAGAVGETVRTNGIETYYERRGDGPPVVFVHGAIMDHGMWAPQMEALEEYTTVAYDVRGHGRTGGSDTETYSIDLFVEDLDALLAALDLDRPVLCGLSMGGCIAGTYAVSHPERISGLVLADTFTPVVTDWRDRVQFAALNAAVLPVRLIGYPRVQRAMTWIQERFLNEGAAGDYGEIERLQSEAPAMDADEFAKVIRSLSRFHEADVDFAAITVPTLVLYGENETGVIKRHVSRLQALIPDVTVEEVPGAGHASNVDNPEFFSTALREFLARRIERPDA